MEDGRFFLRLDIPKPNTDVGRIANPIRPGGSDRVLAVRMHAASPRYNPTCCRFNYFSKTCMNRFVDSTTKLEGEEKHHVAIWGPFSHFGSFLNVKKQDPCQFEEASRIEYGEFSSLEWWGVGVVDFPGVVAGKDLKLRKRDSR
ncbi:hypothetical protein PIB30_046377 [Stylosanthes scabra]|uniref:Uncharacterized protein n=1 Tax=Stylosanthes scabra TaxID=79078 RepID=A0ABU6QFW3_9FABA|nr:hypothetical protein [Stylosanthes scabra]